MQVDEQAVITLCEAAGLDLEPGDAESLTGLLTDHLQAITTMDEVDTNGVVPATRFRAAWD